MAYRGLVVADDLTGATDTGHRFAARGYDVAIARDADLPAADVLVRDTDSRDLAPERAASRVRGAIEAVSADLVYKKVDSTLRGNLSAEIGAAMAETGARLGLVAPAFPAQGRTTRDGHHFVHGDPVASSDVPASLPERLEPTGYRIEILGFDVVEAGTDAVRERLSAVVDAAEPALVICDASREGHLESIARAGAALDESVLYVGSAGLAGHVRLGEDVPVLGVAGSTASETLAGLDALPEPQVVTVDGPEVIADAERTATDASEAVRRTLRTTGRAVVTAARSKADLDRTLAAADDAGLSRQEASERISHVLGTAAAEVIGDTPVGGLCLVGGATADATLDALDAGGIRLAGRAVEAGVPLGRLVGGSAADLPVVTKAGAFGNAETIGRCLDALAASDR